MCAIYSWSSYSATRSDPQFVDPVLTHVCLKEWWFCDINLNFKGKGMVKLAQIVPDLLNYAILVCKIFWDIRSMGNLQDPKMDIPLHRPSFLGPIYGIGTSNQSVPESWPLMGRCSWRYVTDFWQEREVHHERELQAVFSQILGHKMPHGFLYLDVHLTHTHTYYILYIILYIYT